MLFNFGFSLISCHTNVVGSFCRELRYSTIPSMNPIPKAEFTPFDIGLCTNSPKPVLFSASFALSTISLSVILFSFLCLFHFYILKHHILMILNSVKILIPKEFSALSAMLTSLWIIYTLLIITTSHTILLSVLYYLLSYQVQRNVWQSLSHHKYLMANSTSLIVRFHLHIH